VRATAVCAVRRVTDALFTITPTFMKWPELERATIISAAIEERSRFPGVIGAIDGTYINVPTPSIDHIDYINRKSDHSIQLQIICDYEMFFIHLLYWTAWFFT